MRGSEVQPKHLFVVAQSEDIRRFQRTTVHYDVWLCPVKNPHAIESVLRIGGLQGHFRCTLGEQRLNLTVSRTGKVEAHINCAQRRNRGQGSFD